MSRHCNISKQKKWYAQGKRDVKAKHALEEVKGRRKMIKIKVGEAKRHPITRYLKTNVIMFEFKLMPM